MAKETEISGTLWAFWLEKNLKLHTNSNHCRTATTSYIKLATIWTFTRTHLGILRTTSEE